MDLTLICYEVLPNWKDANERPKGLAFEHPNVAVRHQLVESLQWADSQMELVSRGYSTPVDHEGARTLEQLGRVLADA